MINDIRNRVVFASFCEAGGPCDDVNVRGFSGVDAMRGGQNLVGSQFAITIELRTLFYPHLGPGYQRAAAEVLSESSPEGHLPGEFTDLGLIAADDSSIGDSRAWRQKRGLLNRSSCRLTIIKRTVWYR